MIGRAIGSTAIGGFQAPPGSSADLSAAGAGNAVASAGSDGTSASAAISEANILSSTSGDAISAAAALAGAGNAVSGATTDGMSAAAALLGAGNSIATATFVALQAAEAAAQGGNIVVARVTPIAGAALAQTGGANALTDASAGANIQPVGSFITAVNTEGGAAQVFINIDFEGVQAAHDFESFVDFSNWLPPRTFAFNSVIDETKEAVFTYPAIIAKAVEKVQITFNFRYRTRPILLGGSGATFKIATKSGQTALVTVTDGDGIQMSDSAAVVTFNAADLGPGHFFGQLTLNKAGGGYVAAEGFIRIDPVVA